MIRRTACPDCRQLAAQLYGRAADGNDELIAHLDCCRACQRALERIAAGGDGLLRTARNVGEGPADDPAPALRALLERLTKEGPTGDPSSHRDEDTPDPSGCLTAPTDPGHIGRIGHYAVLGVIGRGGMGVVFRAFDERLHRFVAVKVLAPRLAADPVARERFVREARAVAAVRDEHVVAIHAVEEEADCPYLVMELVEGESLEGRLRAGPLPLAEGLRVGVQTALGLAAAHDKGIVHRDIKPANVLVEPGGRVKITDFGLALAAGKADPAAPGVVAGTPAYMAPEQARGEPVDHRADLFSLGSLLYALATGRAPIDGGTLATVRAVQAGRTGPAVGSVADLPPGFVAVVDRLRAADPADRFPTASRAAEELRRLLDRTAGAGRTRTRRWVVAALGLLAAGAVGWAVWPRNATDPRPSPVPASPLAPVTTPGGRLPPRVLIVLAGRDFYFPEYITVRNELTRQGIEVVVTSSAPDDAVPSDLGPGSPVRVGVPLRDARMADFGAVCFVGGLGALEYAAGGRHAGDARRLIADARAAGRIVSGIGVGPVVLAEAGAVRGPATCYRYDIPPHDAHGRFIRRVEAAGGTWVDLPVVVFGSVITGRGPDDALAFARTLVERLSVVRDR